MHLRVTLLAFVTAALGTAISCRAGGNGLEEALAQLSGEDLEIMVLPAEELGDAYADLDISADESGHLSNADAAEDSFELETTEEDLDELGRIDGYDLSYEDPNFLLLDSSGGLLGVVTSVTLFHDAEGASSFLEKEKNDAEEAEGENREGIQLQDVQTRDVDLADEAKGIEFHAIVGELDIYGSAVYLRLDRLVGLAVVIRGDDEEMSHEVERIAGLLHERIRDVLLGDVSATPVPLPEDTRPGDEQEEEPDLDAAPPEGVPDLSAMALSADDVSAGVTVLREGYANDGEAIVTFKREFDLSSLAHGASPFITLENVLELYEDAGDAGVNVGLLEALVGSEGANDLFSSMFQDAVEGESGLDTGDFTVTPLSLTAGDRATGYQASFESAFGRFDATFVVVQVDRALGTISFVAMAAGDDAPDIRKPATKLAERMAAGLGTPP